MAPNDNAQILDVRSFMGGAPARLVKAGFSVNALRTNALLLPDEWKEIDTAVVDVARAQLNGVADLRQYGLVHQLGGLGTIISQYNQISDMSDAELDMSGVTPGQRDQPEYLPISIPVPIIHKDFSINIRHLEASRKLGDALDTTETRIATRKVTEKQESLLFKGATFKVNGASIYGYTTHPNRNTGSAAGDFGTISNIYKTVNSMIAAAEADGYYGPFGLYVATTQFAEMREPYTDGSGQSAMQRCLEMLPQLKFIKPSTVLADGNLVLVTLVRDVVDLAVAQDIVPVEWMSKGGLVQDFIVMTCMVPRVKSDAEGHCGIVHYTGA